MLRQVKTVTLSKHSSFSSEAASSFVTLPRKTRKQGGGQRSCYDGTGPRTSADGFSGPNRTCDEETVPLPPPAMFSEEKSNKFVNFGCAECDGQSEHEKIKSLLKQKKVKGGFKVANKSVEKPDGTNGEVWTRPYRVHYRDPSFTNLQATAAMCEGSMISDVVAAVASIDPVMGGVDR